MSTRNYHLCISVTVALRNWQDSLYIGCVTEDGRTLEPWEVKARFVQAASEGKAVIPMDPSCDNFDYQKGCQGHVAPPSPSHKESRDDE